MDVRPKGAGSVRRSKFSVDSGPSDLNKSHCDHIGCTRTYSPYLYSVDGKLGPLQLFMADKLSKKRRSWNMSRIRSRDTKPELAVRSALHKLGYRFRLHRRDLPGRPDIVLPKYHVAILVHGCFWHRHLACIDCSNPKTRRQYWRPKLLGNEKRDVRNRRLLRRIGWKPIVIWECQTKDAGRLLTKLVRTLPHESTVCRSAVKSVKR